jgi:hypothetical protein
VIPALSLVLTSLPGIGVPDEPDDSTLKRLRRLKPDFCVTDKSSGYSVQL